jgi:hypothetical protein
MERELTLAAAGTRGGDSPTERALRQIAAMPSLEIGRTAVCDAWKAHLETVSDSEDQLRRFIESLPLHSPALDPDIIVPFLEDWYFARQGSSNPTWVPELLTGIGLSGARLYDEYTTLIAKMGGLDAPHHRIDQLVLAALWLLRAGHHGDVLLIRPQIKAAAKRAPYGAEIGAMVETVFGGNSDLP